MKTDMSEMLVIKLYLFEIKSHLISTLPPPPIPPAASFHRAGASLMSGEILSILSPSISRVMYEFLLRKGAEDQSPRLHSGSDASRSSGILSYAGGKEKSCLRLEFTPHFIASQRK